MKTTNLGKVFLYSLIIPLIISLISLFAFGDKVAIIFSISISVAIIVTALVGIENMLINLHNK